MVSCNPYQHSYSYTCTIEDCIDAGDNDCQCPPGFERDCNCDCRVEGSTAYAYLTDCGCNINGGVCPSYCTSGGLGFTFEGPQGLIDSNRYCFDSFTECPSTSGCTDVNANNYNENATIDNGSCSYSEVETIMYKPSVEKMWQFKTTLSPITDPTENFQINNFNNMIYEGVYGVSNIYYLELFINNGLITNTDTMIFAFINEQLRGYNNINENGYCFLEVKWKQQLEPNELITFYIKHNDEIYLINEIKTYENVVVANSYTTDLIYEIGDDLSIVNFQ